MVGGGVVVVADAVDVAIVDSDVDGLVGGVDVVGVVVGGGGGVRDVVVYFDAGLSHR